MRESQRAVKTATADSAIDALRALAITYSDTGSYDEAIRTVEQAIAAQRQSGHAVFRAGAVRAANRRYRLGDSRLFRSADPRRQQRQGAAAAVRTFQPDARARSGDPILSGSDGARAKLVGRLVSAGHGIFSCRAISKQAQDDLHRCSTLQVLQNVPIPERRFECWYIQGQAAEIRGDCPSLIATYNEFRAMAADDQIEQSWTYPPEGPPGCAVSPTKSRNLSPDSAYYIIVVRRYERGFP